MDWKLCVYTIRSNLLNFESYLQIFQLRLSALSKHLASLETLKIGEKYIPKLTIKTS